MHTKLSFEAVDTRRLAYSFGLTHALGLLGRRQHHRVDSDSAEGAHGAVGGVDAVPAAGCASNDAPGHREGGSAQA